VERRTELVRVPVVVGAGSAVAPSGISKFSVKSNDCSASTSPVGIWNSGPPRVVADPPGATGTARAADETASDAAINASLRPANAGTFLMVYLLVGRTMA
jgi:hypothetical protein